MNPESTSPRERMPMPRWMGIMSLSCLSWVAGRGKRSEGNRGVPREYGGTIVEMALASIALLTIMMGIIEMSLALYTYHYVSDAAREATRYAVVRGSSCSLLTNCNATATQIQAYVQGLGYPNSMTMTATTTWWSPSASMPTTWSVCATQCDAPGDMVKVTVAAAFPLSIPFWTMSTLNMSSTSQMVISN